MKCLCVVCSILYVLLEMRILKNVLNRDEFFGGEEREKINQKEESGCQGAQGATWGMLQIYLGAESREQ